jgi:hypothetical protein
MTGERRASTRVMPGLALQGGAAAERTRGTRGALLLVLGTALLASVPLLVVDVPPMLDYPNHLARIHVISNLDRDARLAEWYELGPLTQPNIAAELMIPVLSRFLGLYRAGRVFLFVVIVSTLAGVALLHRALFQRWSAWPLASALIVYNSTFLAGFLNFSLSIGLSLLAMALWVVLENRPFWIRAAANAFAGAVLCFAHFFGAAFYVLMLSTYVCMTLIRARRNLLRQSCWATLAAAAAGVLPLAALLLRPGLVGSSELSPLFSPFPLKLRSLFEPFLTYHLGLDLRTAAFLAVIVTWLAWRGHLRLASPMAAAIGAGLFLFLLLPHRALGNDFVYERFPTALGLLFFAATDVRIPGRVWRRVLAGFVVVLIGLRVGVVAFQWHLHQADLSSMLRVMRLVEPGSKVVVATPLFNVRGRLPPRQLAFGWLPSLQHVPTLAIIERSAFVPSLFTEEGKSAIRVRPKYRHLAKHEDGPQPTFADLTHVWRTQPAVPEEMYWGKWWNDFDYLIVLHPELNPPEDDGFADRLPLTLEAREPLLALYRIGEVQAPHGRE